MGTNEIIYIINEISKGLKSAGFKEINRKQEKASEGRMGFTVYDEKETSTDLYVVRISNHICALHNFSDNYKEPLRANSKLMRRMGKNIQRPYKPIHFYSFVFKEFDIPQNDNAAWNLKCFEYVLAPESIYNGGDDALLNSKSDEIVNLFDSPNSHDIPPSICGVSPVVGERKIDNNNNVEEQTIYNKNNNKRIMKRTIKKSQLKRLVESIIKEEQYQFNDRSPYSTSRYENIDGKMYDITDVNPNIKTWNEKYKDVHGVDWTDDDDYNWAWSEDSDSIYGDKVHQVQN